MLTNVNNLARRRKGRVPSLQVTLFDHAERARVRALPMPARRLARLYGLPPSMALCVAQAAGFNCGGDK